MRLITSLSLGVAALALAGAPLYAQNPAGARPAAAAPTAAVPFAPAPQVTRQTPPPAPAAANTTLANNTPAAEKTPPAVLSNGITATVNDQSISDYELDQRVAFAVAVSGYKPTEEDIKRIRISTLQRLEEEKIQIGEARRLKVSISPVEVNKQIDSFLKDQGASKEQLTKVLAEAGTSLETFRAQQTAFLAWQEVVRMAFQSDIVITPSMVDDAMRRAAEGANKPRYQVSEIFLAVDRPEDEAKVKAEIDDIEKKVRTGDPRYGFRNLARQYSRNPSAALGGDIGWVYDGQLDTELNTAIAGLKKGELSHPVRAKGGWYLLGVRDRMEPLGTKITVEAPTPSGPPGTLPLARLLLPLPAGSPQSAIDNTMRAAMQVREATDSCATLEKIAQDPVLKGSLFMSLGDYELSNLHPSLQKALAETKAGEVAMPIMLDAGVEVFARCDKKAEPPPVAFTMPTRQEVENRLFQEQIAAMARRYLRDLKRDAVIQERGRDNPVVDAALVK